MRNLLSIIFLFGAFLALFAAVLTFKIKHGNRKANRLLSLFCVTTAVFLTRVMLLSSDLYTHFPLLTELFDNIRYFWGPALYFYIKTLANPDLRFKKKDVIHLLPVMLNIAAKSEVYFSPVEYQVQYITDWLYVSPVHPAMILDGLSRILFFLCFSLYIIVSIRFHRKFKNDILQSSPFGKIYLSWIRIFTYSLLPASVIWASSVILVLAGYPFYYFFFGLGLFVSFLVFFFVLKILTQPEILFMAKPLKFVKKYHASYLTDQEAEHVLEKIKYLMEQDQIYLDPDLNLSALAAKLSIPKNYLSQIINEKTGSSFTDFVNHYRIEKVKTWLHDPDRRDKSILTLAFEVGFNSKASFNNSFKKYTGESPVAYRRIRSIKNIRT